MTVKVLISTMREDNPKELIKKMNISTDAVLVNQCGFVEKSLFTIDDNQINYICSDEIGLSRSRNMALQNASFNDIGIIADDDLRYVDNYANLIETAFNDNPEYDIIAFQVEGINKHFKNYSDKSKKMNYITSLKVSSVEIAFRVNKIKQSGIEFNELFGSGANYRMGEENIFLYECLRKGLKIKYLPIKIADLYIGDSSWFSGFNQKYFFDRGAVFTAMSRRWSTFLILQFAIRRYRRYKSEMSLLTSIKIMLKGRSNYRSERLGEK
ncbi:glycosyltransferase family A protein [Bacillus cereus]|uniref:glycosyltransferase family A protein n=1 Tax=Bacillus TaxID=1386 RepID=UPI00111FB60D|nr:MULTISPECIES: glycosyltransferase family A protein [Bacillus]TNP23054.1 glycosyltransferase family 2 protein [Bacillus sp. CD3-5]